jgi:uncharacterized protein YjiS (DUF1127 family)
MSSTKPVMPCGQAVQAPTLLDLARALWRRLRQRPHARKQEVATLSDHLLADIGLNRPCRALPTRERHIHRQ